MGGHGAGKQSQNTCLVGNVLRQLWRSIDDLVPWRACRSWGCCCCCARSSRRAFCGRALSIGGSLHFSRHLSMHGEM